MAEISDLASLDASNTGRWPEGMNVPQLNDAGRALEGILARWAKDTSAVTITQGTGSAYQMLTQRAVPSLASGLVVAVRFHVACNAAPTFQFNSLTAKPLRGRGNVALKAGDIQTSDVGLVFYNPSLDVCQVVGIGDPTRVSGSASFTAATSAAVTLSTSQPDANYRVIVEPQGNVNLWITSKTTGGFTINSSSSITATLLWELSR